jgi:hypothetical protein
VEASTTELGTAEDHPHLDLLNYLADVASVTDHLPQPSAPSEEILPYGTIEDILTAAALAEYMKDEIFSSPVKNAIHAQSELEENEAIEIDIETVEDAIIGHLQLVERDFEEMEMSTQSTPPEEEIPLEPTLKETARIDSIDIEHDLESLISFSEADDSLVDPTASVAMANISHIAEAESTQLELNELNDEQKYLCLNGQTIANDLVEVSGNGDFVEKEFTVFEGPLSANQEVSQSSANRLSMDGNVIFKFAFDQGTIKSPPKRRVSVVSQQDDVSFP